MREFVVLKANACNLGVFEYHHFGKGAFVWVSQYRSIGQRFASKSLRILTMPVFRKKKAGTVPLKKKATAAADEFDIEAFFEDLDVETEARCKTILLQAEHHCDSIRNAYAIEITKLPKKVRSMNAQEFCEQFDGDISLVIERDRKKIMEGLNAIPQDGQTILRTTRSKTRMLNRTESNSQSARLPLATPGTSRTLRSRRPLATPAGGFNQQLPETPASRMPRRGESIMSVNGSPLGAYFNKGAAAQKSQLSTSTLAVSLDNGKNLDLSDLEAAQTLSEEDKSAAIQQLAALQAKVSGLMSRIQGNG